MRSKTLHLEGIGVSSYVVILMRPWSQLEFVFFLLLPHKIWGCVVLAVRCGKCPLEVPECSVVWLEETDWTKVNTRDLLIWQKLEFIHCHKNPGLNDQDRKIHGTTCYCRHIGNHPPWQPLRVKQLIIHLYPNSNCATLPTQQIVPSDHSTHTSQCPTSTMGAQTCALNTHLGAKLDLKNPTLSVMTGGHDCR